MKEVKFNTVCATVKAVNHDVIEPVAVSATGPPSDGQEISAPSIASTAAAEEEGNPLLKSIEALNSLSSAIADFYCRFGEMDNLLKSIQNSIKERSKEIDSKMVEILHQIKEEIESQQEKEENTPLPLPAAANDPHLSELELICKRMDCYSLRKYIIDHLSSDKLKVREEVAAALTHAPNPALFVLNCIGRFYLQGTKSFAKDSNLTICLYTAIVILEFFIFSRCPKLEPSTKEEAEAAAAAVAWRNRIVREGGIACARCEDALGLLLFIVAFGIPPEFNSTDVCELIRVSNAQGPLCSSPPFIERMQDFIQGMVNNMLHIEAVDLACVFGLEGRFSPKSLLSDFLRDANQTAKKMRREGQGSREALKEACDKQLAAYRSVITCLQHKKLNPAELAGWNINEKIAKLVKEAAIFAHKSNENAVPKRKTTEPGSSEDTQIQTKKHQPTSTETPPRPSFVMQPQEHKLSHVVGLQGSLNGLSGAIITPGTMPSDVNDTGRLLTGNSFTALTGTSAELAAGAGTLALNRVLPSSGGTIGSFIGAGSTMPIGNGVGSSESTQIQTKEHQPTSTKTPPRQPSVMQPQEHQLSHVVGLQGSLNGFSGATITPGTMPSDVNGTGRLLTRNSFTALTGTSAELAAGAGTLAMNGVLPSSGGTIGSFVGAGSTVPIGNGVGPLINNGASLYGWQSYGAGGNPQRGTFGLPSSALEGFMRPPTTPMQGWRPHTTPVHGWRPPTTPVQGWRPPTTPVQGWRPPTTPVRGWRPPTTPVQGLRPPATTVQGLRPQTTAVQGFTGPHITTVHGFEGLPRESLESNRYQFVDIVLQGESHHNSSHLGNNAQGGAPS